LPLRTILSSISRRRRTCRHRRTRNIATQTAIYAGKTVKSTLITSSACRYARILNVLEPCNRWPGRDLPGLCGRAGDIRKVPAGSKKPGPHSHLRMRGYPLPSCRPFFKRGRPPHPDQTDRGLPPPVIGNFPDPLISDRGAPHTMPDQGFPSFQGSARISPHRAPIDLRIRSFGTNSRKCGTNVLGILCIVLRLGGFCAFWGLMMEANIRYWAGGTGWEWSDDGGMYGGRGDLTGSKRRVTKFVPISMLFESLTDNKYESVAVQEILHFAAQDR